MNTEADYEIRKEHILFGSTTDTRQGVIRALVGLLAAEGRVTDEDAAVSAVLEREAVRSTGLARGVACPHAKTTGVTGLQVAIARLEDGIDFGALDGIPARHVILILSAKTADGRPHIHALSSIVKCYHDAEVVRMLEAAGNAAEYAAIMQAHKA